MNENQKKVTDTFRTNYDTIFGKKETRNYKAEFKTLADDTFKSVISNDKSDALDAK